MILGPPDGHALSEPDLYRLLVSPEAREEWVHLTDHHHSIRFLVSAGWVFKTRPPDVIAELDPARQRAAELREHTARLRVWHPAKTWFLLRQPDGIWLCNATPLLTPLPDVLRMLTRLRWRRQWLRLHGRAASCGWVLDPKPMNFGHDAQGRLYYLDDEVYTPRGKCFSLS